MADNNTDTLNGIIQSMMKGMDGFLSSKTVVGEPTKVGDTLIVPFVDVSFGVGAGGKNEGSNGGGLTGKMTPSAVLVISNGTTRLINIRNQDNVGKILDMVPDLVNRVAASKEVKISNEEAIAAVNTDKID